MNSNMSLSSYCSDYKIYLTLEYLFWVHDDPPKTRGVKTKEGDCIRSHWDMSEFKREFVKYCSDYTLIFMH